jgi:histidinol-phosphate aminotransferase
VRPELRELAAYHLEQTSCRYKLDQNEVPWDLPVRLKEKIASELVERNWARYPDFHADELRRALGRYHDWPLEGVLVGNGSNELLGIALEALTPIGGEVVGAEPCFGLYEMLVRRAGGRPRFLAPRADLRLPIAELGREVEGAAARPALLCSPNNPTGAAATVEEIDDLLARLEGPLLLDNAYGEFCRFDYRSLLRRHRHLVLFRTLSKAWSLAGMRLGYLLADPGLVEQLVKVKLPYNLGHAGAVAGRVAIAAAAALERRVTVLVRRREQWTAMLRRFGLEVFDSEANFLLVRAGEEVAALRDGLAERGILVRDVSGYPGLAGCMRIGVGSGAALRATERALREILGAAAGAAAGRETA